MTVTTVAAVGNLLPLSLRHHPNSEVVVSLPEEDVRHVARLARLFVTDDEVALFAPQLNAILGYAEQVAEVAADDVEPMVHPFAPADVARDDIPSPSLSRDAILAGAPAVEQMRFAVPRIVAEEG
ncbi:MAG: Asp-tRNA(Asn)/Glu-tRNA(Gln) amidotransferase subunit GatC [Nitriliruptoraceae bacterium]